MHSLFSLGSFIPKIPPSELGFVCKPELPPPHKYFISGPPPSPIFKFPFQRNSSKLYRDIR